MLGGNASAVILLGLLWTICFVFFAHLRREQFLASLLAGIFFPTLYWYGHITGDPTIPPGPLHALFLFFSGGLASICYHVIFGQYYLRVRQFKSRTHEQSWVWQMLALTFIAAWIMVLFGYMWPHMSGGIIMTLTALCFLLYYTAYRQDLLFDAVMSAFLMLILFASVDLVLSGPDFDTLPADFYLQAFGLGLFFGPLYEFTRNLHLQHVPFRLQ